MQCSDKASVGQETQCVAALTAPRSVCGLQLYSSGLVTAQDRGADAGFVVQHTQGCFVHEWTDKSGLRFECRLTLLYTNT